MTATQKHHRLPPPLCEEVFNASIRTVPTSLISAELARDLLAWWRWLVRILGIEHGKITITMHQNYATKVKLSFFKFFPAESQCDFDPVQARRKLDEAVHMLTESKGRLQPIDLLCCIQTICWMLFRWSDNPYGKFAVTVRNKKVTELRPSYGIRADKPDAEEQVSRRVYTRR